VIAHRTEHTWRRNFATSQTAQTSEHGLIALQPEHRAGVFERSSSDFLSRQYFRVTSLQVGFDERRRFSREKIQRSAWHL
jgi:hypothetical protein